LVGELDQPDTVVVADGAERKDGRQLCRDLAFLLEQRPELLAGAGVNEQHYRQLALLDEALDEGVPHARGNIPVDRANVVAGLVLADLFERDAGALEDAVVLAAKQVLHGTAGLQLEATNLTDYLMRDHARSRYSFSV